MVFVYDGIEEIQSVGIRGNPGVYPDYASFSGSDNTYTGSESMPISNEFIRKQVTWTKSGIQSKYFVQLSSLECVGSYVGTFDLASGSAIGSGTLFTINRSYAGNKTNAFNVQVEGEIVMRKPNA